MPWAYLGSDEVFCGGQPIGLIENEPLRLLRALKHDQLMTKRDDLGLNRGLSSKPSVERAEHHYYKVEHGRKSLTAEIYNLNNSNADDVFSNHS
jgi:hypothetical protein